MINRYSVPVRQGDFESSISDMSKVCSAFKIDIFRSTLANGKIDSYKVRNFMSTINTFLRTWEAYALDLQDQIKSANPKEKDSYYKVIEYQEIKPFIFASYDYASILQFADGIVRGAKNTDISKTEQYEDFFKSTARSAFKDRPADAGMMVSEVTNFDFVTWTSHENSLFMSNKHKNFFDNNDRIEIYKAVDKTIEYLVEDILSADSDIFTYFTGPMRSSACNWIIEYVKLTLTAFACRIYAISAYAASYIDDKKIETVNKVNESVEEIPGFNEQTYMRDLDESIIHNPINYLHYLAKVIPWLSTLNSVATAPELNKYLRTLYMDDDTRRYISTTKVYNSLISNSLYDYFDDINRDYLGQNSSVLTDYLEDYDARYEVEKIVRHIKDFVSSKNLGVGMSTSPLQDLVERIKNAQPTNAKGEKSLTVEGYEQLAIDITLAHLPFASNIHRIVSRIIARYKSNQDKWPTERYRDMAAINEIHKMLIDIYKTFGVAVLFRLRDIEMAINDLKRSNINKAFDEISIKIPGMKSDYSKDDNNAMAVPDTNRSMTEAADIISLDSAMDQLVMYDEWVKSLPEMENDWYYSEAFNFQDIIDKILAIIKTIGTKAQEFFTNTQLKAATKWTQTNGKTLLGSKFTEGMNCLNYKLFLPNGNMKEIKHIDVMIDTINTCNPATDFKDQADVDKYIEKLYSGMNNIAALYNSTHKQNKPWNAKAYKNVILFDIAGDADPTAVTVAANQINGPGAEYLPKWIRDVNNSENIGRDIQDTNKKLTDATTALKQKIVALNAGNGDNEQPPVVNAQGEEQQKPEENKPDISTNATTALNRTNQAILELYQPLFGIVSGMILQEYKYIQEAWSKREQPTQ